MEYYQKAKARADEAKDAILFLSTVLAKTTVKREIKQGVGGQVSFIGEVSIFTEDEVSAMKEAIIGFTNDFIETTADIITDLNDEQEN